VTSDSRTQTITAPPVPNDVVDAIHRMRCPIFLAHVVPDADALGSMLAMSLAWTSDACKPGISLPPGSLSQRLSFMVDKAQSSIASSEDFRKADGFVVLDTAQKSRCNIEKTIKDTDWSAGRCVVNVDHHDTNTRFGDVNWVVSGASSTSELVYYLIKAAGKNITPAIASLL